MKKKIFVILVSGIFIFAMNKLSFAQSHSEHGRSTTGVTGQLALTEPVNIGNKICPVSGEKINEKMKQTYEHEGKVYNFCCTSCIDEFKKDPEKYINKVNKELEEESMKEAKEEKHEMEMGQGQEASGHHGMHEGHQH